MTRHPIVVSLNDPNQFRLQDSCRAWVRRVQRGDFADLPDDPTEDELAAISVALHGYRVAEQAGWYGDDLLEWARARFDAYQTTGTLPDSSLDLWLMMFALQRQWRIIVGSGPAGETFLAIWRAVYHAWRDAIRLELGNAPAAVSYVPGLGRM